MHYGGISAVYYSSATPRDYFKRQRPKENCLLGGGFSETKAKKARASFNTIPSTETYEK
jgi:hypothetical protein